MGRGQAAGKGHMLEALLIRLLEALASGACCGYVGVIEVKACVSVYYQNVSKMCISVQSCTDKELGRDGDGDGDGDETGFPGPPRRTPPPPPRNTAGPGSHRGPAGIPGAGGAHTRLTMAAPMTAPPSLLRQHGPSPSPEIHCAPQKSHLPLQVWPQSQHAAPSVQPPLMDFRLAA